jgi:hypothetical protein
LVLAAPLVDTITIVAGAEKALIRAAERQNTVNSKIQQFR